MKYNCIPYTNMLLLSVYFQCRLKLFWALLPFKIKISKIAGRRMTGPYCISNQLQEALSIGNSLLWAHLIKA